MRQRLHNHSPRLTTTHPHPNFHPLLTSTLILQGSLHQAIVILPINTTRTDSIIISEDWSYPIIGSPTHLLPNHPSLLLPFIPLVGIYVAPNILVPPNRRAQASVPTHQVISIRLLPSVLLHLAAVTPTALLISIRRFSFIITHRHPRTVIHLPLARLHYDN